MADPRTPSCDKNEQSFAKQGGITNGAAWYSVEGGTVQYNPEIPWLVLGAFTSQIIKPGQHKSASWLPFRLLIPMGFGGGLAWAND